MEQRHLRYFVCLAEDLHFGRAADRLNVSVATLSQQLRALEGELGARLLNRKTKSAISLTQAGSKFLPEAQAAVLQFDRAALIGRKAGRGEVGTIMLGYVMAAVTSGILQKITRTFAATRPDVVFQLQRLETYAQMEAVAQGRLDAGITRTLKRYPSGLTGIRVHSEPYILAIPEGHRLARLKSVPPAELAGEPLLAAILQKETRLWENMILPCAPEASVNIVARAQDMLSVLALVASGLGIGAVTRSHERIAVPGIAYRRIAGPGSQSETTIIVRSNDTNPLMQAFLTVIRGLKFDIVSGA